MRNTLASTLLCISLSTGCTTVVAAEQTISPTLLQRIRALLGLVPPVAAGGSRGDSKAVNVCLISPLVTQPGDVAVVPIPRPTILTAQPLNEVRIEQNGQVLWQKLASSTQPVAGRIPWPVEPVQPGEELILVLRPRGSSGGDVARIRLQGASVEVMTYTQSLLNDLHTNPWSWEAKITKTLNDKNHALAVALLNEKSSLPPAQMKQLQNLVATFSCQAKP